MPDTKANRFTGSTPSTDDLVQGFESLPLSIVRANLSKVVDRVAYSGDPVVISKHDQPTAVIVPLSMLAQTRATSQKLADLPIKAEADEPAERVSFEAVEGLRAKELDAVRGQLDEAAQRDDAVDEQNVRAVVCHPYFEQSVENVILRMLARGYDLPEGSNLDPHRSTETSALLRQIGDVIDFGFGKVDVKGSNQRRRPASASESQPLLAPFIGDK